MNDINEIIVNTFWAKNNLSSALVFERDYKIKMKFWSVWNTRMN